MKRIAWTKFQDFYLRPGFLKVLTAVLSAERRSVPNDAIIQRLRTPLFDPVRTHADLLESIKHLAPRPKPTKKGKRPKREEGPTVAEGLLIHDQCPSVLFAITGPTAYKIVDWGRDVEFIGRGNQITERGLLLRYLLDDTATSAFLSGDVKAWNPFLLTLKERLFLLYHLAEIDGVIDDLLLQLGELDLQPGTALESGDAARMTCKALLRVLKNTQGKVPPAEVLRFRTASALAATIAEELEMADEAMDLVGAARRKLPKAISPRTRRAGAFAGSRANVRKTTKNADHQTIPRFEQLVDLGFLTKPGAMSGDESEQLAARKRWQYVPTDVCRRWAAAVREQEHGDGPFLWNSFAAAAIRTFQIAPSVQALSTRSKLVAEYVWKAYEHVHRRVGANPLDSVALFAMISAASDGVVIEMSEIHRFMLSIRKNSLFPEHVFFSSGNELDRMFIQLRPGFLEKVAESQQPLAEAQAR
jgi:hypothetical protein